MKIIYKKDDLIFIAKKIKTVADFNKFIEYYSNYLEYVMERDISNVNANFRNDLKNLIIEFIFKAYKEGYINERNMPICLERIIKTTQKINIITTSFGVVGENQIGFNFASHEFIGYMKHYVFHELTHCITDVNNFGTPTDKNNSLGIYRIVPEYIIGNGIVPSYTEPILTNGFMRFLNEIMAESTACYLADSFLKDKQTAYSSPNYIKTNWHTPYNQTYQQLGYEFIRTFLFPNCIDEKEIFKKITLLSINGNNIGKKILEAAKMINQEDYKEDLHRIALILENILNTHSLFDDDVKTFRNILKKYANYKKNKIISISPALNSTIQITHDEDYSQKKR